MSMKYSEMLLERWCAELAKAQEQALARCSYSVYAEGVWAWPMYAESGKT